MSNVEATIYVFNKGGKTEQTRLPLSEAKPVICSMLSQHACNEIDESSLLLEKMSIDAVLTELVTESNNNQEFSTAILFKDINIELDNDKSTLCIETHLI